MTQEYLLDFCQKINAPEAAVRAFVNEAERLTNAPDLYRVFAEEVTAYEKEGPDHNFWPVMKRLEEAIRETELCTYTVMYLFFIACFPKLEQIYAAHGYSEEMLQGVRNDMRYKLKECYAVKGVWGSFVYPWFMHFFTLHNFPIGRLQFEIGYKVPEGKNNPEVPHRGEKAINVHIPSAGPLTREILENTFRLATAFFADQFEGDTVLFMCHTWLLSPDHVQMLPETSGIRVFQSMWDIVDTEENSGSDTYWRVFNTYDISDVNALPDDSTLRRGYIHMLKNGLPPHAGLGLRLEHK